MKLLLWLAAAVVAYIVSSWNPAITLSKAIYHKDIRTCGSGNPGFTNFKRTFGNKWAWWVMLLDMCKSGVVVLLFAFLFRFFGYDFQIGAAFTGIFALIGHAYPVRYEWKGGKGFLVTLSVVAVVDWRVGLAAFVLMTILLLTTDYMSLSTVTALLLSPVMLIFLKYSLDIEGNSDGDPVEVITHDLPLIFLILVYAATTLGILYFAK